MRVRPRAAVLGSPIDHSLSPVLHRAAYAHLGLDWRYDRIELQADEFAGFVDSLDDSWRGLSVTMPLKEAAARCGEPDDDVVLIGAANTVVLGERRHVHNTDIAGLVDALAEAGTQRVRVATMIGNGATARSALVALVRCGAKLVEVQGRSPERLAQFGRWAQKLDVEVQPRSLGAPIDPASELLLSTVPSAALAGRLQLLQVPLCPALKRRLRRRLPAVADPPGGDGHGGRAGRARRTRVAGAPGAASGSADDRTRCARRRADVCRAKRAQPARPLVTDSGSCCAT